MSSNFSKKIELLNQIKIIIEKEITVIDNNSEFDMLIIEENKIIEQIREIDNNLIVEKVLPTPAETKKLNQLLTEINELKKKVISDFEIMLENHRKKETHINTARDLANKYYQKPPAVPRFFDAMLK